MKRHTIGYVNGIIASASYGTNPLFALPLYNLGIGTNSILFYRYFLAVAIYLIWIKFIKKVSIKITQKEFIILLLLGMFFSMSSLTLFDSFRYIEVGIACTILFIYPIIVVILMALFFGEKITKRVIVSIFLTFTGIILLYKGKADSVLNIRGVLMVLLSAVLYAFYIVGVKNISIIKHMKTEKLNFYVMLFGLMIYIFNLKFCTKLQILDKPIMLMCVLGLALFPTVISIETINIAIKLIGSTKTAILGALEPLTAIIIGVIVFNEQLSIRIIIGVILILSGVTLIVTKKKTF